MVKLDNNSKKYSNTDNAKKRTKKKKELSFILLVGSQIVAHTLTEAGNGPNRPNTIDL